MIGKKILLVQHMPWEGPGGHLRRALLDAGLECAVAESWHQPLPPLDSFTCLIVLGGSPNVDEEEEYPYLKPLKAMIRETVASGRAYLGFCLGHQLLAHVLGCRVGPLPQKAVGFLTGRLTPADLAHPVFQGLPQELRLFKWHGQGVLPPLPAGVEILAASAAAPVEALGLAGNPRVVGLQFDKHADAQDAATWLAQDREWALAGGAVREEALRSQALREEAWIGGHFRQFLQNFCPLAGLT
ncbi:MAG: type 1 glutamine amidotransferase [Desulfobaccales bacterium]